MPVEETDSESEDDDLFEERAQTKRRYTTQVQQRFRSVLETLQLFIQQHTCSEVESDQAWVSLCQVYIVWTLATADCERGFSVLKRVKTASRNLLSYNVLNQLMMIMSNGPSLQDFDFDEAARVFIGWKERRSVSVPHLQTSTARASVRAVVAYSWTKDSAIEAFEAVLPQAKELAEGEDISGRLVGSAVSDAAKEKKQRIRKKDQKKEDAAYGTSRARKRKTKNSKKSKKSGTGSSKRKKAKRAKAAEEEEVGEKEEQGEGEEQEAAEKEEQEEAGEKEPDLGEMEDEEEGDQGGAEAEPEEEAAEEGVDIDVPPQKVVPEMHADKYPTSARSGRVIRSKYDLDGSSLRYSKS